MNQTNKIDDSMNQTAFKMLVSEHYRGLYRFAFALTGKESEASDLTQQTFCIWAEKGHRLRDETKARAWLFTTLNREFLKGQRRLARFPEREFAEEHGGVPDLSPSVVRELDARLVVAALGRLDRMYRTPLALFYLEDHSYREIAEILAVPIGTIKSRIARGKERLGSSLKEQSASSVVRHG